MRNDWTLPIFLLGAIGILKIRELYSALSLVGAILLIIMAIGFLGSASWVIWEIYSKPARDRRKRFQLIREIPRSLLVGCPDSITLGVDPELKIKVYLPDAIRMRHVHIAGATGTGKSESVILNFIRQDVSRGLGAIILDAKGDASFLAHLRRLIPQEKLKVFDLGSRTSLTYDPLAAGAPMESAQRLFSSMTWSEEYYKSRAFSVLQKLFEIHSSTKNTNPRFTDLAAYLDDPEQFAAVMGSNNYPVKLAQRDFEEVSGLRDQVRTLCTGHLASILSPNGSADMQPEKAYEGQVLYFRLQSLMSPQLVGTLGKLIINHLNYLAGTAHRAEDVQAPRQLVPVYLDEFASFACPEFADLISKARSAGLALHFSHQSVGDLAEVSDGFLSRITDCSATKIVLRMNDPDSAEFFARSFGTKLYQKITQRVTNATEIDRAEILGEGTQREAHQFRASPDLFKGLPTGVGSVLIAHGYETPHGASTVFKIKFPKLEEEKRT